MNDALIFKLLSSLLALALVSLVVGIARLNKSIMAFKFYLRKICNHLGIEHGKDLE